MIHHLSFFTSNNDILVTLDCQNNIIIRKVKYIQPGWGKKLNPVGRQAIYKFRELA